MNEFQRIIRDRSRYAILMIDIEYVRAHVNQLKGLLHERDAVESRLDVLSYQQYVEQISVDWRDDLHMGCAVVVNNDATQVPVGVAFANLKAYREDVRRPMELNWPKTNAYRQMREQWCLEYLVRDRQHHGRLGVGCFALVGLLSHFSDIFSDVDAMMWLQLAGGFNNRAALSLYTDVGFFVTSLDSDKTPIMSLQVQDIAHRPRRKLLQSLSMLREEGPDIANADDDHPDSQQSSNNDDDDDGEGHADDDDDAQEHVVPQHNLRRRRRRRDPVLLQRPKRRRERLDLRALAFRSMKDQLTLEFGRIVVQPRAEGLEQDLVRHLWSMAEMTALNPQSQSFLIHLNVAKQCHYIASQRHLHVSRYLV